MPRRVVPSQVIAFIKDCFYEGVYLEGDPEFRGGMDQIGPSQAAHLRALLDLVDSIPPELLTMPPEKEVEFALGREAIRHAVELWAGGGDLYLESPERGLRRKKLNPVALVYGALSVASDEPLTPMTHDLAFVDDKALQGTLLGDIAAVERAVAHGEWKAATVLAGSVVEALLLWALKRDARASSARSAPGKPIDNWHLADLSNVVKELGLLSENTSKQIELAKDYRNLIHPGRAIRSAAECNRGTARAASAALEFVVKELATKPQQG